MVRFTVPISDILGNAYYRYEITSSNYNPSINGSVTISVRCTNVFGTPVPEKSVTLYNNGTSLSTSITNQQGVATFSYTFSDWDNHTFHCGNASLQVRANGFKLTTTKTNNVVTYQHYADESSRTCIIVITSSGSFNIANGEQYTITGLIPSKYAPKHNLYCDVNRNRNISFYCWTGGTGGLFNSNTTTQTNQTVSGQITYSY